MSLIDFSCFPKLSRGLQLGLLASAVAWMPSTLLADGTDSWYAGVFISDAQQDTELDSGVSFDESRTNIRGKVGFTWFDYVGFEGQFGLMGKSSISEDPIFNAGAYVRVTKQFEKVNLYALGGVALVETYDNKTGGEEVSEVGLSYGGGIELFGNETSALALEMLVLVDTSETTITSIGIGYVFDF